MGKRERRREKSKTNEEKRFWLTLAADMFKAIYNGILFLSINI
jgi:hypothetical protein